MTVYIICKNRDQWVNVYSPPQQLLSSVFLYHSCWYINLSPVEVADARCLLEHVRCFNHTGSLTRCKACTQKGWCWACFILTLCMQFSPIGQCYKSDATTLRLKRLVKFSLRYVLPCFSIITEFVFWNLSCVFSLHGFNHFDLTS